MPVTARCGARRRGNIVRGASDGRRSGRVDDVWNQGATAPMDPREPEHPLARCGPVWGADRSRDRALRTVTVVTRHCGRRKRTARLPPSPERATYVPHRTVNKGEPRGTRRALATSQQVSELQGQTQGASSASQADNAGSIPVIRSRAKRPGHSGNPETWPCCFPAGVGPSEDRRGKPGQAGGVSPPSGVGGAPRPVEAARMACSALSTVMWLLPATMCRP